MTFLEKPVVVLPPHHVSQSKMLEALSITYAGTEHLRALRLAEHTTVQQRQFILPLEQMFTSEYITTRQMRYTHEATKLATHAIQLVLNDAREIGIQEQDITHLILVSCTSPAPLLPGLDAYVTASFNFDPFLRRLPIAQMGCHGGATALAQAHDCVLAHPDAIVLVVAIEIPSLNNQPEDLSPGDFVSRGLFGDGCAALLVHNRPTTGLSYSIIDTAQHLIPGTLTHMQFLNTETGNHFSTSKKVVPGLRQGFPFVHAFLEKHALRVSDLDFIVSHTGGPRVLDAVQSELGIPETMLANSRASLRECGNLSSASVLDVLRRSYSSNRKQASGSIGLLLAFGPGSTIEMMLMKTFIA